MIEPVDSPGGVQVFNDIYHCKHLTQWADHRLTSQPNSHGDMYLASV